ncbi:MAG: NTP transferase domain-containing protein, partial [Merismopedia sp. SIO2A8]|nr:NTP transferase domain-containing protein [Merismopedia sp. SIO2A8]
SDELIKKRINVQQDSQGPLVGFYQGFTTILSQTNVDWILLLACDLPNLNPAIIQAWSTTLSELPPSTIAALPPHVPIQTLKSSNITAQGIIHNPTFKRYKSPKQWHPLCGFYHRRCLHSLEPFIATGGRSFQRWLANEEVRSLPIPNPNLLFNCNTPEDWKRLGLDP